MITLHHGDCLDILPTLEAGSVDMVLCDLPYGTIDAKWDSPIPLEPLWEQYKRLIKPNSAIVLFGSQPFTTDLINSNRTWFKYCLVWYKTRAADFVHAKNRPMRIHEDLIVFSPAPMGHSSLLGNKRMTYFPQGVRATNRLEKRKTSKFGSIVGDRPSHTKEYSRLSTNYPKSVLEFANVPTPVHPTQKPVPLLQYLIRTYTNKGDTVLDNAMGAGSTGVACIEEGRSFIGIEKDAGYFEIAKKRIHEAETAPRTMRMELTA